ncbi:PREDICTED: sarcospan [Nanorana parkeri]|uniref:sarcospan n=1 Tax=Nanorana parkeri TaxID=125878 RepID=UPI000854C7CC|nr:PREDICTED: sarcospan [Nanorana parkeri]
MGADNKHKQSPASQEQPAKGQGDSRDKKADQKKQKKEKKAAKAGAQDEAHTCCGCRFPLLVALLQLTLGLSVAAVAFIMAANCSSLLVRDTPHWAGIIVSVVAILGLILLCLPYQPDEKTSGQFALKLLYFLLSALGIIICVLAVAFAAHHYTQITKYSCKMEDNSCQCTLDPSDPLSRTFLYKTVADCTMVTTTIKLLFLLQITLNLLLAMVCLATCFIMWKDRYQVFYSGTWFQGSSTNETPQQKV